MGPKDETQVVRFRHKCLYQLSHFRDLIVTFSLNWSKVAEVLSVYGKAGYAALGKLDTALKSGN